MPWLESWPIRAEDAAFADSASTGKDSTDVESFLVAAETANATSSPLIGHGMSDTYHRSG